MKRCEARVEKSRCRERPGEDGAPVSARAVAARQSPGLRSSGGIILARLTMFYGLRLFIGFTCQ